MKKCLLIITVVAMLAVLLAGCGSKPLVPDVSDASGAPQKTQDVVENQSTKKPTAPATSHQVAPNDAGDKKKELPAQEKTKDLAVTSKDQSPPAPSANKEKKITLADLPSPAAVRGKMEAVYFTRGKPVITVGSEPFALYFVDVGNKYDREEIDVQIFLYGIESPDRLDPKVECVIWQGKVKPGELIHLPPLKLPKESEDLLKACLADTSGVFGAPFFMARVNGYVSEYVAELAQSVKKLNDNSYEIDYGGGKKVIRSISQH